VGRGFESFTLALFFSYPLFLQHLEPLVLQYVLNHVGIDLGVPTRSAVQVHDHFPFPGVGVSLPTQYLVHPLVGFLHQNLAFHLSHFGVFREQPRTIPESALFGHRRPPERVIYPV